MVHTKIRGDTSMKTRTLVRKHGWTPVEVGALPIDWSLAYWNGERDEDDRIHYQEIVEWCNNAVGSGNYACTLQNGGGTRGNKRFIFRRAEDATMFRSKWLTS